MVVMRNPPQARRSSGTMPLESRARFCAELADRAAISVVYSKKGGVSMKGLGEQAFEGELELIHNNKIRSFVVEVLRLAPHYFWHVPSSTSGKHHPPDESEPGGRVLHTKRAVYVAHQLARMEELPPTERDLLLAAMIVHDICCQGLHDVASPKTDPDHPILLRKKTAHLSDEPHYDAVMSIVDAHMGRWGPVMPESKLQRLAHTADYISSRRHVRIDPPYSDG